MHGRVVPRRSDGLSPNHPLVLICLAHILVAIEARRALHLHDQAPSHWRCRLHGTLQIAKGYVIIKGYVNAEDRKAIGKRSFDGQRIEPDCRHRSSSTGWLAESATCRASSKDSTENNYSLIKAIVPSLSNILMNTADGSYTLRGDANTTV